MSKNKIVNLNVPCFDLDGKELANVKNLGKLLANVLVAGSKGDVMKFYDWAVKLNNGETLDLDRSDYEKLRDFVKENESLTILAKGQILPLLENDKLQKDE